MKMYGLNERGKRFTVLGRLKAVSSELVKAGRSREAFDLILRSLYRSGDEVPDGVVGDSVRELIIEL